MNKTKFLIVVIVGLIITNLLLIAFVAKRPRPNHPTEGPKQIVIEKLGLNNEQVTKYEALIAKHRELIDPLDNKLRLEKEKLYKLLVEENQNAQVDSILGTISAIQLKIEEAHFNHFRDLKELCTPDQLSKYKEFTEELSKIFKPMGPGKR